MWAVILNRPVIASRRTRRSCQADFPREDASLLRSGPWNAEGRRVVIAMSLTTSNYLQPRYRSQIVFGRHYLVAGASAVGLPMQVRCSTGGPSTEDMAAEERSSSSPSGSSTLLPSDSLLRVGRADRKGGNNQTGRIRQAAQRAVQSPPRSPPERPD